MGYVSAGLLGELVHALVKTARDIEGGHTDIDVDCELFVHWSDRHKESAERFDTEGEGVVLRGGGEEVLVLRNTYTSSLRVLHKGQVEGGDEWECIDVGVAAIHVPGDTSAKTKSRILW